MSKISAWKKSQRYCGLNIMNFKRMEYFASATSSFEYLFIETREGVWVVLELENGKSIGRRKYTGTEIRTADGGVHPDPLCKGGMVSGKSCQQRRGSGDSIWDALLKKLALWKRWARKVGLPLFLEFMTVKSSRSMHAIVWWSEKDRLLQPAENYSIIRIDKILSKNGLNSIKQIKYYLIRNT